MSQKQWHLLVKIKTIREGKDITVEQLANQIVGFSCRTKSFNRRRRKLPSLAPLTKIARNALGS